MKVVPNDAESTYIRKRITLLRVAATRINTAQFSNYNVGYSLQGLINGINRTTFSDSCFTDDLEKFNILWKGHNEGHW